MNCPACGRELKPVKQSNGSTQFLCDCIGFPRVVIEIIPPEQDAQFSQAAKGVNKK